MTFGTDLHNIAKGRPGKTVIDKCCPRCHGNMMLEFDFTAGYHRSCINCGYIKYLHRPSLKLDRQQKQHER